MRCIEMKRNFDYVEKCCEREIYRKFWGEVMEMPCRQSSVELTFMAGIRNEFKYVWG